MVATLLLFALIAFAPDQVKVLGSVEYGQPTPLTQYTGQPPAQAFGFNARPGDQLDVLIETKSAGLKAYLTDAKFRSVAGGNSHFAADVPGDQPATFYIVITSEDGRPAEYRLDLERPSRKSR